MSGGTVNVRDAVFVSWSGQRGGAIAAAVYGVINTVLRDHKVDADAKFSPVSQEVGGNWREQLEEELAASKFGILVLDATALRSFWVAFETGYLVANNSRLFPILLSANLEPIRGTPFETVQVATLSQDGVQRMFTALSKALGDFMGTDAIFSRSQSAFDEIQEVWARIQDQERFTGQGLVAELQRVVRDYSHFGLIDTLVVDQYSDLLSCPRTVEPGQNASLLAELSRIVKLFRECESPANGDFGKLATTWALKNLIVDARERLVEVTSGQLSVRNRAPVREFWTHSVFGRAEQSVWTTNVAKPGANMGGALDRHLLDVQERSIKRGVQITRLFVYDPSMTLEEADKRRELIRRQIELGIDVRVITRAEFDTKAVAENATRRIGSNDFMIIDDRYLYLTFPDESDDIEARMLNGRSHTRELEAARAFKQVLESWADEMTLANLDRFPASLIG